MNERASRAIYHNTATEEASLSSCPSYEKAIHGISSTLVLWNLYSGVKIAFCFSIPFESFSLKLGKGVHFSSWNVWIPTHKRILNIDFQFVDYLEHTVNKMRFAIHFSKSSRGILSSPPTLFMGWAMTQWRSTVHVFHTKSPRFKPWYFQVRLGRTPIWKQNYLNYHLNLQAPHKIVSAATIYICACGTHKKGQKGFCISVQTTPSLTRTSQLRVAY